MIDSFIPLIFFHAWPTHFIIKILRWLAGNLPSTYNSKCLSRWSSKRRRTSFLNGLLTVTSTTCTRDVHPCGILQRDVHYLCQMYLYTICLLYSVNISNQNLFVSYHLGKWVWPFFVNSLLHDVLIAPSFLLKHKSHAFVVDSSSFVVIRRPFPLKMIVGRTLSTLSANIKLDFCLSFI